jgi:hypothetical protein
VLFPLMLAIVPAGVLAAWLATESSAQNRERAKLPRPVVNTHVLMERFQEPLFEALSQAVKQEPADRMQWRALEQNAIRAAEIANLTAIREVPADDRNAWLQLCEASQSSAQELAAAAKSADYDSTRKAWGRFVEACNACHKRFEPEHAPVLEP